MKKRRHFYVIDFSIGRIEIACRALMISAGRKTFDMSEWLFLWNFKPFSNFLNHPQIEAEDWRKDFFCPHLNFSEPAAHYADQRLIKSQYVGESTGFKAFIIPALAITYHRPIYFPLFYDITRKMISIRNLKYFERWFINVSEQVLNMTRFMTWIGSQ